MGKEEGVYIPPLSVPLYYEDLETGEPIAIMGRPIKVKARHLKTEFIPVKVIRERNRKNGKDKKTINARSVRKYQEAYRGKKLNWQESLERLRNSTAYWVLSQHRKSNKKQRKLGRHASKNAKL